MGRRKIDIQYLQDDRVRKVTFCKRKGGLFKKADDLAKLCGVEVAVIIIQENDKLCTYASTMNDVDRVINRFQGLKSGVPSAPDSTIDKLYNELEMRRRELEDVQRQLLQEKRKVEAFVGQDVQMLTVRPVDMTQMNPNPPMQALPTQSWNPQNPQMAHAHAQQMHQMHQMAQQQMIGADTLSISAPVLMDTAAAMSAQRAAEEGQGSDSEDAAPEQWEEQHPAKRTKLDVAAEVALQ